MTGGQGGGGEEGGGWGKKLKVEEIEGGEEGMDEDGVETGGKEWKGEGLGM